MAKKSVDYWGSRGRMQGFIISQLRWWSTHHGVIVALLPPGKINSPAFTFFYHPQIDRHLGLISPRGLPYNGSLTRPSHITSCCLHSDQAVGGEGGGGRERKGGCPSNKHFRHSTVTRTLQRQHHWAMMTCFVHTEISDGDRGRGEQRGWWRAESNWASASSCSASYSSDGSPSSSSSSPSYSSSSSDGCSSSSSFSFSPLGWVLAPPPFLQPPQCTHPPNPNLKDEYLTCENPRQTQTRNELQCNEIHLHPKPPPSTTQSDISLFSYNIYPFCQRGYQNFSESDQTWHH